MELSDLIKYCPAVVSLYKLGFYFWFTQRCFKKGAEREYVLYVCAKRDVRMFVLLSRVQMEDQKIFHLTNA